LLAAVLALDLLLDVDALQAAYALPPLVAALAGGRWAAALAGIAAVVLTVLSGLWDSNFGSEGQLVRVGITGGAAAVAFAAARSAGEARSSIRRFGLLNDVASVADGSTQLPETMRLISDLIVPELADYCMLDVVSEGRIDRVAVRASGPERERIEAALMRRPPSLPEQILAADDVSAIEPRFWPRVSAEQLRSIAHDEEDFEFLSALGVRSVIQVGLSSRGRRIGALTVVTAWSGRRYHEEDVRFANVLGDRVALALDNAGLFSDLQSIEQRMDSVMEVLAEAVVIFDRSRRLVFANDAAARMLGFESAKELLGAPEGTLRERFDLYHESGEPLDPEEFLPFLALRGGASHSQIVRAISREEGHELWLRAKSRVVEGIDGEPLYSVTALDDVTELKETEFQQSVLVRLAELFSSALDYDEMAQRMAEMLIPQLADWCTIYALEPNATIVPVASAHADPGRLAKARQMESEYPLTITDEGGPGEVMRTGEPAFVANLGEALGTVARDNRHRDLLRELGFGSAMLLPMRVAGEVIAVLALINQSDRRPLNELDSSLAEKIAIRAAVALRNARLATERTEIARTLQEGLLPAPLPHIPGWSVAALYRPAGSENEVGGDFYDAFLIRGGWMLVVGDVTGRGAQAASITGVARYTLRTASALSGDPLVALAALNRALILRAGSALCTVAAIAVKEERGAEVEIAVAGHPPPLLVDPAGVREAAGTGPVLGAFPDASWELARTRLAPDDQLVVYTDGVTEAVGPEGRFGEDRLRARLRGASSPVVAVQRIEEALEAFCRGNLDDDAAILALTPAAGVAGEEPLERLVGSAPA
jgi:PAS domain S-box-containing protein